MRSVGRSAPARGPTPGGMAALTGRNRSETGKPNRRVQSDDDETEPDTW